jgi:hypothetical protein
VAHILIEFLPQSAKDWEVLGRFRASPEEIAQLRELLEHKDPAAAIDTLPHGIVRDTLRIIILEHGHEARVTFLEDE